MLPGRNDTGHGDETMWNVSLLQNAHRNGGSVGEFAMVLRQFEMEMRTTSKIHALIAIPYV